MVRSCYKEKFGAPRQPGLAPAATGRIQIIPPYHNPDAWRGLEEFSHIWVLFWFDKNKEKWRPTVRPPRLGGNTRIGLFSSRSGFRPNPIGLSCLRLRGIDYHPGETILHVEALDLIDQTPVIDIKPYIPYSDAIEQASAGYAQTRPESVLDVDFSQQASEFCTQQTGFPELRDLISQTLALDPRPAYQIDDHREYGIHIYDFNIRWQVKNNNARVLEIRKI